MMSERRRSSGLEVAAVQEGAVREAKRSLLPLARSLSPRLGGSTQR